MKKVFIVIFAITLMGAAFGFTSHVEAKSQILKVGEAT